MTFNMLCGSLPYEWPPTSAIGIYPHIGQKVLLLPDNK